MDAGWGLVWFLVEKNQHRSSLAWFSSYPRFSLNTWLFQVLLLLVVIKTFQGVQTLCSTYQQVRFKFKIKKKSTYSAMQSFTIFHLNQLVKVKSRCSRMMKSMAQNILNLFQRGCNHWKHIRPSWTPWTNGSQKNQIKTVFTNKFSWFIPN